MRVQVLKPVCGEDGLLSTEIVRLGYPISRDIAEWIVGAMASAGSAQSALTLVWERRVEEISSGLVQDGILRKDEITELDNWMLGIFRLRDPETISRVAVAYRFAWDVCGNTNVFMCLAGEYSYEAQCDSVRKLSLFPELLEGLLTDEQVGGHITAELLTSHTIATSRYYDGEELFFRGTPLAIANCYERLKSNVPRRLKIEFDLVWGDRGPGGPRREREREHGN